MNTPKMKEDAPAAESVSKRCKRTKDKLVRFDVLIREKDVKAGHQVLFGVTDTTQTKTSQNKNPPIEQYERRLFPQNNRQNFDATNQPLSMRGGSFRKAIPNCPSLDLVVG